MAFVLRTWQGCIRRLIDYLVVLFDSTRLLVLDWHLVNMCLSGSRPEIRNAKNTLQRCILTMCAMENIELLFSQVHKLERNIG